MSQQHDWLNLGPASEAGAQAENAEGAERTASENEGVLTGAEKTSDVTGPAGAADHLDMAELSAEAEPSSDADLSTEDERLAGATSVDENISGWSGRAIGPLSGLLPGGAVGLTAGEVPVEVRVEPPTSVAGTTDHELASATAAGADGDEPPSGVPVVDKAPTADTGADEHAPPHAPPIAVVVPTPAREASASDSADGAVPEEHGSTAVLATDDAQPDDASPAALSKESDAAAEAAEPGLTSTDDRWHAALVGFVDDPRGSVEAAKALIDTDIAAHIALLARRREAMHAAWQSGKEDDTEALRLALVSYRDLRKRLADVVAR